MKIKLFVFPLVLSAAFVTCPRRSFNSPSAAVNRRELKTLPIEKDEERAIICQGFSTALASNSRELVDESVFDRSRSGEIHMLSYKTFYAAGKTLFTLGAKLSASSKAALAAFPRSFSIAISAYPSGPTINADHSSKNQLLSDGYIKEFSSSPLKSFKVTSDGIFVTIEFSQGAGVKKLDLTISGGGINFEKIQVSKGGWSEFPGFVNHHHAPCLLPSDSLDSQDIYLDVPSSRSEYIVGNLVGATFGFDAEDDSYIYSTLISDDYTLHAKTLGRYFKVVVMVTDQAGNSTSLNYHLRTVDRIKPTIVPKAVGKIRIPYRTLSEETVLSSFAISDNDVIKTMRVDGLDCETAKKKMGDYLLSVTAEDNFGNASSLEATIEVFDDVPPEVEAPDEIELTTSKGMSDQELLALFAARDEIDGEVELAIELNEYRKNPKKVGAYNLTVIAKDLSENYARKTATIKVRDDTAPVFVVYRNSISSYVGEIVDVVEALNALAGSGALPAGRYLSYTTLEGEDLSKPLALGTHHFKVLALTDKGESRIVELELKVDERPKVEKKTKGFWQQVGAFFANLFKSIRDFFTNLF